MDEVKEPNHALARLATPINANVHKLEQQVDVQRAASAVSSLGDEQANRDGDPSEIGPFVELSPKIATTTSSIIPPPSENKQQHAPTSPLRLQPRKPSLALSSTSSSSAVEPSTQTLSSLQRANQLSHGIIEENYAPVYDIVSTWEFYAQANSPSVSKSATPTYYLSMDREGEVVVVKDGAMEGGCGSDGWRMDATGNDSGVELLKPVEEEITTPESAEPPQTPIISPPSLPLSLPQIDTTPLFPIDLTTSSFLPSPDPATIISQPPITVRKFHLPVAKHKYFESLLVQLDDKAARSKMDPAWVAKLEEFRMSGTLKVEDMPEEERRVLKAVADAAEQEQETEEATGGGKVAEVVAGLQELVDEAAEQGDASDVAGISADVGLAIFEEAPIIGRNREGSLSGVSLLMDYYTPDSAELESYGSLKDRVQAPVVRVSLIGPSDIPLRGEIQNQAAHPSSLPYIPHSPSSLSANSNDIRPSSPISSPTSPTPTSRRSSTTSSSDVVSLALSTALNPDPKPSPIYTHQPIPIPNRLSAFVTPDHSPPRKVGKVSTITGPQLLSTSSTIKTVPISEIMKGLQQRGKLSPGHSGPSSPASTPGLLTPTMTRHSSGHSRNESESSVAFWDQIDEEAKRERQLQKERERELKEHAKRRNGAGGKSGSSVKSSKSMFAGVWSTLSRKKDKGRGGDVRSLHERSGSRGGEEDGEGRGVASATEGYGVQMRVSSMLPQPPSYAPHAGLVSASQNGFGKGAGQGQGEQQASVGPYPYHAQQQQQQHHPQSSWNPNYVTAPASPARSLVQEHHTTSHASQHTITPSDQSTSRTPIRKVPTPLSPPTTPRHTPKPSLSAFVVPPPHAPPSDHAFQPTPQRRKDDDNISIKTVRTVRSVAMGMVTGFRKGAEEGEGRGERVRRKSSLPEGLLSFRGEGKGWFRRK